MSRHTKPAPEEQQSFTELNSQALEVLRRMLKRSLKDGCVIKPL